MNINKKELIWFVRGFCLLCFTILVPLTLLMGSEGGGTNWFYSLVVVPGSLLIADLVGEFLIKFMRGKRLGKKVPEE